jgi:hypothetical protein
MNCREIPRRSIRKVPAAEPDTAIDPTRLDFDVTLGHPVGSPIVSNVSGFTRCAINALRREQEVGRGEHGIDHSAPPG